MAQASFEAVGAGAYRVSGPLDFTTVPVIWKASLPLLRQGGGEPSIDLAGVSQVDSAGLALLLEWVRLAGEARQRLRILGMPDKLLALARMSETEGFLAPAT
ncbi:MAG: STAS domain-containing protein [Gammaproteobacteria bacterium]|nr:STAS domain-containing protein [Gammaproteobacteria bacterium]